MKKIILVVFLSIFLFSCWINTQNNKKQENKIIKNTEKKQINNNLENYIWFIIYDKNDKKFGHYNLNIKYNKDNIEKIKKIIHWQNLISIKLENIKLDRDIEDIILLIKNNIKKERINWYSKNLIISFKYSQLNDEILSILMDFDLESLDIIATQDCSNGVKNYYVNNKLWEKILNRKVKDIWVRLMCENEIKNWCDFLTENCYGTLFFRDKIQEEKFKNNYFKETNKLENYIQFWTKNNDIPDIKYDKNNIEKIKKILHRKDLLWINLVNIKSNIDLKNILLLVKDNVLENNIQNELSITLKFSQLNDKILSLLMDIKVSSLLVVVHQNCSNGIKDYFINKKLWNKILNRKTKKMQIMPSCNHNIMESWNFNFEDEKQSKKLIDDKNFSIGL